MASNVVPDNLLNFEHGDNVDDIFRCPVCSMPYNSADGRTPKMLPACHHTFCLKCLKATDANQRRNKGYMECPLCRTRVDPDTKMENLATNFYLPRFKEVLNRSPTDMSTVSDGAGAAAASTSRGQSTSKVGEFCSVHASKQATYWCKTCDCVICDICSLNEHSSLSVHFLLRLDKNVMTKITLELIERTSERLSIVRSTSSQLLKDGVSFPMHERHVLELVDQDSPDRTRVVDNFRAQTGGPTLDFYAEELKACLSVLTAENDITKDDVLEVYKKVSTVMEPMINNLMKLVKDMEKNLRDFAYLKALSLKLCDCEANIYEWETADW